MPRKTSTVNWGYAAQVREAAAPVGIAEIGAVDAADDVTVLQTDLGKQTPGANGGHAVADNAPFLVVPLGVHLLGELGHG